MEDATEEGYMQPVDQIILRTGEKKQELPVRRFRDGIFGATLEDALQRLLADHPNLIPGRQMKPGTSDPPRFFLLKREMPVFGWSLDHLFVDQFGVLTLVETKLLQNPESRRDVIGQIIEYAANAKHAWAGGLLQEQAAGELEQKLKTEFGLDDDSAALFWEKIGRNLENGRFRLIIVGDELRPEVRRIIEYLNREMANAEVYGLEIRCYGDDQCMVIVPYLVGGTDAKQVSASPMAKWAPERLREVYEALPQDQVRIWLRLLEWVQSNSLFIENVGKTPSFGIRSSSGKRLGGFSPQATWFYLSPDTFVGGREELRKFCDELKDMNLIKQDVDPELNNTSRNTIRALGDLSEPEFERFISILERYTIVPGQVNGTLAIAAGAP